MGFYSKQELEKMPSSRLGAVYGLYVILDYKEDADDVIKVLKERPLEEREFIERHMLRKGYGELISNFREKFLNQDLAQKTG